MVLDRTSGNPAILPGSALPYRGLYQQCANSLPVGAFLIVLPPARNAQRLALESIALQLQGAGHRVQTMVDEVPHRQPAIQASLPLLGV